MAASQRHGFMSATMDLEANIICQFINLPRASRYVKDAVIFGYGEFHPVLDCTQYALLDLEELIL